MACARRCDLSRGSPHRAFPGERARGPARFHDPWAPRHERCRTRRHAGRVHSRARGCCLCLIACGANARRNGFLAVACQRGRNTTEDRDFARQATQGFPSTRAGPRSASQDTGHRQRHHTGIPVRCRLATLRRHEGKSWSHSTRRRGLAGGPVRNSASEPIRPVL